jgi:pilus assembly protein CpaB
LQDLDWQVMEPDKITENMLREDATQMESLTGAIVRRQLRAGEPVMGNALTRAGEGGFMAAVLEPGHASGIDCRQPHIRQCRIYFAG